MFLLIPDQACHNEDGEDEEGESDGGKDAPSHDLFPGELPSATVHRPIVDFLIAHNEVNVTIQMTERERDMQLYLWQ